MTKSPIISSAHTPSLFLCSPSLAVFLFQLVLRDNPEIQRVNTARKNLDATTRLLDKFRSLPEQAEALIEELDADDHAIKGVYKALRKLFLLRDSAMDAPGMSMSSTSGGHAFSADFQRQLQENFAELSKSAEEIEERIWENITDASFLAKDDPITLVRTLEVIELEDRAMRKVFGHTAKKEEAVVPSAGSGKEKGGKRKGDSGGASTSVVPSDFITPHNGPFLTMREKCLNHLEKSIADLFQHLHIDEEQWKEQEKQEQQEKKRKEQVRAEKLKALNKSDNSYDDEVDEPEEDFPSPPRSGGLYHSDDEDDGDNKRPGGPSDYILTILEEMTDLVESLIPTLSTMIPCFPPDYNIAAFYIERYLRWLKLTVSFHTNDPTKLSKKAQLKTVNWIEWYRREVQKWDVKYPNWRQSLIDPNGSVSEEKQLKSMQKKEASDQQYFDDLIKELMKYYTSSTEETLIKLCDNILNSDMHAEAEKNSAGHYVTSGPPDLFYTINSTIEIVLSNFGLHSKPLTFVCLMLSKVFEHYQNRQLAFLGEVSRGEKDEDDQLFFGEETIPKSDTYFAAIINNSTICQEHMDDLKEKILDRLREAEALEAQPLSPPNPSIALLATGSTAPAKKSLIDQMEDLFEESGEGFVSVASEGIDLLVLQISITLQKPMANLFTPSWLKDSGVTDDIVLTLQDFMSDYQVS